MKKRTEKKLSLGKIKIASLSKPGQQMINGGRPNNGHTASACRQQSCESDAWAQCRSTPIHCW